MNVADEAGTGGVWLPGVWAHEVVLPESIPTRSHAHARAVLHTLASFMSSANDRVWKWSSDDLAEFAGMKARTWRVVAQQLDESGLILRHRPRLANGVLGRWEYRPNRDAARCTSTPRGVESQVVLNDRTRCSSTTEPGAVERTHQGTFNVPTGIALGIALDVAHELPVSRVVDALAADLEPEETEVIHPVDVVQSHPVAIGTAMQLVPTATATSNVVEIVRDDQRLCELLADSIAARGSKRPTITAAWRTDMDRLIRIDGHDPDEIAKVIRWLAAGRDDVASFWSPNVRSPHKLRLRWDQMAEQFRRSQRQAAKGSNYGDPSADAGARALQRANELRNQRLREEATA